MGKQRKGKGSARQKTWAETQLRSHYGLAKRAANEWNKSGNPQKRAAVEGIMKSTAKYLRMINAERAKHYQKPLTIKELIEIIRESE